MDEASKQTAQILLDFYTGMTLAQTEDDEDRVFDDAFDGLEEAGSFTVEVDDEDEVELDVTPLLIGTTVTTQWLISQLSAATDYSEEEILFDLRDFIGRMKVD